MTPRQYAEYQRQADAIDKHKIHLLQNQIDELDSEITWSFQLDEPHRAYHLKQAQLSLKQQLSQLQNQLTHE